MLPMLIYDQNGWIDTQVGKNAAHFVPEPIHILESLERPRGAGDPSARRSDSDCCVGIQIL